jgi:hypothetical protein
MTWNEAEMEKLMKDSVRPRQAAERGTRIPRFSPGVSERIAQIAIVRHLDSGILRND